MNKQIKGIIFTLCGAICWGFSGTCGQYLFTYKNIESGWLTMIRMILAGIILLTVSILKKDKNLFNIWHNKKDLIRLFIFSIFGLLVSQYTYLTAIYYSNAGTATVLQYLNPVMIMLLVCFASARFPDRVEIISILLAVSGTFLLATHGNIKTLNISEAGLMWGILSAVGAVLYSLIPGKIVMKYGSMAVTGYGMLLGGILFGLFSNQFQTHVIFDFGVVTGVIAISVVGTAVAYTLFLEGIKIIGAVKASMLASAEPVAATVFSVMWLKTPFIWIDLIGFILIMTTVFLLTIPPDKRRKK